MQERLLRLQEVEAMIGFRKVRFTTSFKGKIPESVKIGKSNRWAGSEVSAWIRTEDSDGNRELVQFRAPLAATSDDNLNSERERLNKASRNPYIS